MFFFCFRLFFFFFQAEDGIRDRSPSRGLGDVYKRQLKLDLFYIENYSFLLDIKLIFMTVKIFFQKEVSEGVDDRQVNALKDSGKNAGVSENKTEE